MRKLTRRSYNRKLIVFGLAIFLAFGMISTGFAAWLISATASKESAGPVEVDTIVDKSFELTVDQIGDDKKWIAEGTGVDGVYNAISFDAKENDTEGRVRYQGADGDRAEQLTLRLSGKVSNKTALLDGKLSVDITLPVEILNAMKANYLTLSYTYTGGTSAVPVSADTYLVDGAAKAIEIDITPAAIAESTKDEGSFEVVLTFAWGTAFNKQNPCEYYDEDTDGKAKSADQMRFELATFRGLLTNTPNTYGEPASTNDYSAQFGSDTAYSGTIAIVVTAEG